MSREALSRNERVKLAAGFVNAIALGFAGFAVAKPIVEDLSVDWSIAPWIVLSAALHLVARALLGDVREK